MIEKLKTGEITKKCEILCKKIRSLTDQNMMDDDRVKYQRIIYCSDEKTIKKVLLPPHDVWLSAEEAIKYGIADFIKELG